MKNLIKKLYKLYNFKNFITTRGFTLIELLVVIAIIGILSSVVLVSLGTTREKGRDASAKVSMTNILIAAELFYDDNTPNSYTDICVQAQDPNTEVGRLIAAVDAQTGETANCAVKSNGQSYVIYTNLNQGNFCVDSNGYSGALKNTDPDNNFKCQ